MVWKTGILWAPGWRRNRVFPGWGWPFFPPWKNATSTIHGGRMPRDRQIHTELIWAWPQAEWLDAMSPCAGAAISTLPHFKI